MRIPKLRQLWGGGAVPLDNLSEGWGKQCIETLDKGLQL